MILAGDVGGTNTRLALVEQGGGNELRFLAEQVFPSRDFEGVGAMARAFLSQQAGAPRAACFAVAGPVIDGRADATNLGWVVDQRELSESLGIERLAVINDLESNAYGIAWLAPEDIDTINEGAPGARGNAAVVSPGTGLGEAGMYWDGRRHWPFAAEGGHTDFAARTRLEFELLEYLRPLYGEHISSERVVSGPGLVHIYEFLRDTGRGEEPTWLADEMRDPKADPAACISNAALSQRSALCERALDMFIELFGAEAGNMALKVMARGGVWLGGGIVVKIRERIKATDSFMKGFAEKGRLSDILRDMPVRVILNDKAALLGAARYALDSIDAEP